MSDTRRRQLAGRCKMSDYLKESKKAGWDESAHLRVAVPQQLQNRLHLPQTPLRVTQERLRRGSHAALGRLAPGLRVLVRRQLSHHPARLLARTPCTVNGCMAAQGWLTGYVRACLLACLLAC